MSVKTRHAPQAPFSIEKTLASTDSGADEYIKPGQQAKVLRRRLAALQFCELAQRQGWVEEQEDRESAILIDRSVNQ
jgi:hypothetical protein